jgi:hypothetical protein
MSYSNLLLYNTSIITDYGIYKYWPVALDDVIAIVRNEENLGRFEHIISCIGHQAVAEILSDLLDYKVEVNRNNLKQTADDLAIVFKLNSRVEEGRILNRQEVEDIGYSFGFLKKLE